MKIPTGAILCAAMVPAAALAGQEVGEWAMDAGWCEEARLVFTADGTHESRMFDEGGWQSLASAPYRREGDVLVIDNPGETERLEVLEESAERLVLRNADPERRRQTGVMQIELVRCGDGA